MTYTAEQLRDMASLIEEQAAPVDEQRIKMLRAFADALEKLKVAEDGWKRECDDANKLLRGMGLQPEQFRTEGGSLMVAKALNAALEENARLMAELAKLRQKVAQQAEDEGLWFRAATAPEAYLQQELRKLHAAVEETK